MNWQKFGIGSGVSTGTWASKTVKDYATGKPVKLEVYKIGSANGIPYYTYVNPDGSWVVAEGDADIVSGRGGKGPALEALRRLFQKSGGKMYEGPCLQTLRLPKNIL